jgi:hypothetical protein
MTLEVFFKKEKKLELGSFYISSLFSLFLKKKFFFKKIWPDWPVRIMVLWENKTFSWEYFKLQSICYPVIKQVGVLNVLSSIRGQSYHLGSQTQQQSIVSRLYATKKCG